MTDDSDESITRRESMAVGASALSAALLPGDVAAVDDTLTTLANEAAAWSVYGTDGLISDHLIDSSGSPTWLVQLDEEDEDAWTKLEDWEDGDDRRILERYEVADTAYIRADPTDISSSASLLSSSDVLADRRYVETIDLNIRHELPEPVTSLDDSGSWLGFSTVESLLRFGTTSADLPTDGVAFDDVEPTDMQDALAGLNADGLDGSGITIAVIDTGINDAGGSVFGDRILETSKNAITDEVGVDAIEDGNGHGSFVAAQMAGDPADAAHQGVLPNADVLGIKALGDDGGGSTADIAAAVRYAADENADVICMSLGSPLYSFELDRALNYAEGAGSVAFAAVGNDRYGSRWVASPSSTDRSISVASITAADASEDVESSYFSNVGPHPGTTDFSGGETEGEGVDIAAPGHEVRTTVPTTAGGTVERTLSGTSMAAPIAAAVAAEAIAGDEDLEGDHEAVRERLADTAAPIEQCAAAEVGPGRVDGDQLLDGGERDESQEDAMTDAATSRDDTFRTESGSTSWIVSLPFFG